jgi:hypothetical protein
MGVSIAVHSKEWTTYGTARWKAAACANILRRHIIPSPKKEGAEIAMKQVWNHILPQGKDRSTQANITSPP